MSAPTAFPSMPAPPVVELRQYRLQPGRRDELIELFDREFVETQEATGMTLIGQFRDLDRPDHFVWIRGFAGMTERRESLAAFYGGPVWARHGQAAVATMIDSDDVLLLRPMANDAGFALPPTATRDDTSVERGFVLVIVHSRGRDPDDAHSLLATVVPALEAAGATTIGVYETEPSPNTFPRLPVRDDDVVVWFGACASTEAADAAVSAVSRVMAEAMPPAVLCLAPTSRSLLTGHVPPRAGVES